jgi:HYR domain-containing protein/NHL repeat-containing protein
MLTGSLSTTARNLCRGLVAAALLITCGAGRARAQETWAPIVMFDGITKTVNGQTTGLTNGPVLTTNPVFLPWDFTTFGNAPFLYPNGFCENAVTHEWIVADTYHGRLLRFATDHNPDFATGTFLGTLTTSVNGERSAPYGPVVDDQGTILTADSEARAIKAFVPDGAGYDLFTMSSFTDALTDAHNPTITAFLRPYRIVLLPDHVRGMKVREGVGSLLVLDSDADRVLKLQPTGGVAAPAWSLLMAFGQDAQACGCVGPGVFNFPTGLAVDAAGDIYVSDPNNAITVTVQVFDPEGRQRQVISQGLSVPWSLAIAPDGRLFVADTGNNRISVFSRFDSGNPAGSLVPTAARISTASQPLGGVFLPAGPNPSGQPGQLQEPTAIAFDHLGRLLVADTDNARVQVFARAPLSIAAIAVPQTVAASAATVDVRVTVTLPPGDAAVTNVLPEVPSVIVSPAGGSAALVVDPTPACVITPASSSPADCRALAPLPLAPGGQLTYTFRFNKVPSAAGPVWFSTQASGLDGAGAVISSATVRTYAVAINGNPSARAPVIAATLAGPSNGPEHQGWFAHQPVVVALTASVSGSADGIVQEIEYNVGSTPPGQDDYYTCFSASTSDHPYDPACALPIYLGGRTRVWYRALTSRGLYDTLVPNGPGDPVRVPGWSSIDLALDFTAPTFRFGDPVDAGNHRAVAHHGWFNTQPLTVTFTAFDAESQLDAVGLSASGTVHTIWNVASGTNVPFTRGTVTFASDGDGSFAVTASDMAGNSTSDGDDVLVDATPPSIGTAPAVASPTPVMAIAGVHWSRSPITVIFGAVDYGSGFDAEATATASCTLTVSSGSSSPSCTFEDWAGNTAVATAANYRVDDVPPVLTAADITAAGGSSAVVHYSGVSAIDNVDPSPAVSCSPASGSTFPLGVTTVACTAVDAVGNSSSKSFTVTVVVAPPTITVPASMTVQATSAHGAPVTYTATAVDAAHAVIPVICVPPSGSMFPLGATVVTCTATDAGHRTSTRTFIVTVIHSVPICTGAVANPSSLWPPNHRLESVGVGGITSADGGTIALTITSIFQDEPTNAIDNDDLAVDGFGVGTSRAQVRVERSGKLDGRVYYIGFTASSGGASCTGTVTTSVPHDQGHHGAAVGQGPLFNSTR